MKKQVLFMSLAILLCHKASFAQQTAAPVLGATSTSSVYAIASGSSAQNVDINLGNTKTFGVFTAAGAISITNGTTINGDLGNDAGAVTGFIGSSISVLQQANPVTAQANLDVHALFAVLSGLNSTTLPTFAGGETIVSGNYSFGAAASLTGSITLDGQGDPNSTFFINVGGVLNTAAGFQVNLINGAAASNVYWSVLGAVNLGAGTIFQGTLVAEGAVSVGSGSTVTGKILVTAGAINLDGGSVGSNVASAAGSSHTPPPPPPPSLSFPELYKFGAYTAAGAISNTNNTVIDGFLGNDAGAITGFGPGTYKGTIHQAGDPIADQANLDVHTLFANLGALPCDNTLATFTGNETLAPGVYCFGAAASLDGTLTLNATGKNDPYVFNIGGVLNTAPGFKIVLIGVPASNVTWRVLGAVNLGANTTFKGALVAEGAVSVGNGSKLAGGILVTAGAINLDGDAIKSTYMVIKDHKKTSSDASAAISSFSELSNALQGNFSIIQNPVANHQLRINMPTASTVTIYSNLGQVLVNKTVAAGTQTIALPTLAKGIYHVRCGRVVKKFVVQ